MRDIDLLLRRLAVTQFIVEQLEDTGKIKIQKILYFLQEAIGLPLQYRFRMHHYGPFSEDIENDISVLQAIGSIKVVPDQEGYGYHVTPTSEEKIPWDNEIQKSKEKITQVVNLLKELEARDLELYATVHFVQNLLEDPSKEQVLNTVSRVKPQFSRDTILEAYDLLIKAELIH